jgi:thiol-disulfide isomerase/thioredoxin
MTVKPAICATVTALALGLGACGGSDDAGNPESELSASEAAKPIDGAPPQLQAIRDQANELLYGGAGAFGERLAELRGTPVVVNKWASWCGPCRAEFPYFQSQAQDLGGEIAFLGVDSKDAADAAETFLTQLPLPYPSYFDPDQEINKEFLDSSVAFPATAFYDASGELAHVKPGAYASEADLAADIERYAE